MKKNHVIILSAIVVCFSSCSQNEDLLNGNNPIYTTQAEANLVLANYLLLIDKEYVLEISQEKAVEIGISIEMFINAQNEIRKTNEIINELENDPNCELQLTNPQEEICKIKSASMYDHAITGGSPTGTLKTNGQEVDTSPYVWAPMETQGIKFTCKASAAITPVYTCKTYSSGLWRSKTAIGAIGINTEVKVPLYVSNDNIRVSFQTTDSNGGSAHYKGY